MREREEFDCWVDDYRKMFEQCGRKFGTCMETVFVLLGLKLADVITTVTI